MIVESIPKVKPHLHWLRFFVAAMCAVVLVQLSTEWRRLGFDWKNAWILFSFAAIGLSALIEGFLHERPHLLISAWQLHVIATGFIASWAAGASSRLGIIGLIALAMGLALAIWGSLYGDQAGDRDPT